MTASYASDIGQKAETSADARAFTGAFGAGKKSPEGAGFREFDEPMEAFA
jgi:hypothetical protein